MSSLDGWDITATVAAGLGLGEVNAQWDEPEDSQQEGDVQTRAGGYIAMSSTGSQHKGAILFYRDKVERRAALVPGCATAQVQLIQRVGGPTEIEVHSDDESLCDRKAVACFVGALVTALQMQREWDKEGYDGKMED